MSAQSMFVCRNAARTAWIVHAGIDPELCGALVILNFCPTKKAALEWVAEQQRA